MEIVLGALPSLLPKLAELLAGEYNLQKEVKGGIMFLQEELESMKAALEDISETPPDQVPRHDKIWARNVRELSYDIEDNIDTFMVQVKGRDQAKKHGIKKFIDKTLGSLMQPKIRRKIATNIREMKGRVIEVHERRRRYEVRHSSVDKPVKFDPRALVRYEDVSKLVGIDEAKDEVIEILTEVNKVSKKQEKIVSIVGFGGLGKTTLANVVCEKLRAQFDCYAFVSVSQTPDMDRLFKDMLYQVAKRNTTGINVIDELREFLRKKRYFIVIDDIWETTHWNWIRCALPDDRDEYRIITTTRILTVAKQIGGVYEMQPLSLENSRILMYARIFGKEEKGKCPDEQLAEVSRKILNKCAGVPLAIITIASLLASKGRNKLEWYNVCNSIGTGLKEGDSLDNMRKVLSLSYYDMPSHLRSCWLYLSMFPEDSKIYMDCLIWLWIAEGFVQPGEQGKSLFETGESYFNELINRSMIQPVDYDKHLGQILSCRVHDIVLDLICSLSSEENFVTVWKGEGQPSSVSEKVRRLSLQNAKDGHDKLEATMSMEHVRSVVAFPHAIDHVPTLRNMSVLRVLDLKGCDLSQGYSLKYLGNLLHLRYLGLMSTSIHRLPEEIGNLRSLQTLDVRGNQISSWPSTIVLLTHLKRLQLSGGYETTPLKGIRSLTSLEDLCRLRNEDNSIGIIEELSHLKELRKLDIAIIVEWNDGLNKSLVESLNKLDKVRDLCLECYGCCLDGWVAPRHLRQLKLGWSWFSTLPAWMSPSLLPDLAVLRIGVRRLQQEDLEILGSLPALRSLTLSVVDRHGRFTVAACSFPCLIDCKLTGFGRPVLFEQGAMPKLENLFVDFSVKEAREIKNFGLGNLLSLQMLVVWLPRGIISVEEAATRDAVTDAIEAHPNHPTLSICKHLYYRGYPMLSYSIPAPVAWWRLREEL